MKEVIEECKRQLRLSAEYDVEVRENNQVIVRKENKKRIYYYVVLDNEQIRFFSVSKRNNKGFLCMVPESGIDIQHKNVKSQNGSISKNKNQVKKQALVVGMVMATAMLTLFPTTAKGINNNYQKIEKEKDLEENYDMTSPVYLEPVSSTEESLEETKVELQEIPEETMEETHEEAIEETTPETTEAVKPVFYDVKCPADLQEFMYETCLEYGVPFQIGMTIGHIESRGNWNNSGKLSSTNDYGFMQINKVNMNDLYEKFHKEGESKEEFLRAMQYNDKRNIKCQ